jgi:cation diffusion facilitator CzcD-associated flavoprotein CzcO
MIDGLHSFKGKLAHSADWDTSLGWKDKKIAVIGTGSSSIQMVPHLAKGINYSLLADTSSKFLTIV